MKLAKKTVTKAFKKTKATAKSTSPKDLTPDGNGKYYSSLYGDYVPALYAGGR